MFLNIFSLYQSLRAIDGSSLLYCKKYLFCTIRSFSFILHQELFLANILARNGAVVYVLLDDGVLPHWDTYQIHDKQAVLNPSVYMRHKLQRDILLRLYAHSNIKILYISDLIKNSLSSNNVFLSMADVMNIEGSIRRYFECGYFDPSNPKHIWYRDISENNCRILKLVGEAVKNKFNLDVVLTSHGIYSLWGTLYNYFRECNLPVYVYGAHAYRSNAIQITDSLAQTLSLDSQCVNFMLHHQLSELERNMVSEYFQKRIFHKTKDTLCYYGWMGNSTNNFTIQSNGQRATFAIFPNIIWDGNIVQKDTIFKGLLDLMLKTIEFFKTSDNILVIRYHPAEATLWKDSVKLKDVINEKVPDLDQYKNICIIQSDDKIDTYSFVKDNVDCAIVYDGILALELSYMGIPVIVPSKSRFSGGNYVFAPKTLDEYWRLLRSRPTMDDLPSDWREELLKYSYWYFFDSAYCMPIYSREKFGEIVYNKKTVLEMSSSEFRKLMAKLFAL